MTPHVCQARSRGTRGAGAAAQLVASSGTRDALGHGCRKQGALGLRVGMIGGLECHFQWVNQL